MIRFSIPAFIKFVIGTLVVQGATALLVCGAQAANLKETWLPVFGLALLIGLLAALWFSSIARHSSQHVLARARQKFDKERKRIRHQSDREHAGKIKGRRRQLARESRRVQRRKVKLGAALAGLVGVSAALFFTQFMALGLLAFFLSTGALLGYSLRARRHRLRPALRLDWSCLRNLRRRSCVEPTASGPTGAIGDRRVGPTQRSVIGQDVFGPVSLPAPHG